MVRRGALCPGTQGPGDAATSPSPPGAGRSQERIPPPPGPLEGAWPWRVLHFGLSLPRTVGERMPLLQSTKCVATVTVTRGNGCSDVSADSQAGGGASRRPGRTSLRRAASCPTPRGGSLPDATQEARAAAEAGAGAGAGAAGAEGAGGRRVWGRSSFTLPVRWEIAGGFSAQG